jgi:DUF438 domain-containing protein
MKKVQADFKENFSDVPAKEIAKAEQKMMADGAKMEDIQKLCDIHSALFEDMTDEERMQRLKEEMEAHQVKQVDEKIENVEEEVSKKTIELKNTYGHPLNILTVENDAIKSLIDQIRSNIQDNLSISDELKQLMQIKKHYAKKDDLLLLIDNIVVNKNTIKQKGKHRKNNYCIPCRFKSIINNNYVKIIVDVNYKNMLADGTEYIAKSIFNDN